ncbi:Cytochrome P450 71A25 [Striga hermonthica]|uniref:Cytochrome P450 71A25 n=1 Tax=Striga hermonthica TaxID=68872 RepID=A0A9N7NLE8_STRHE|nr:Cytochrome P450 71A25 [Striga hermonthica]
MKSIFVHQLLSNKRVRSMRTIREQETYLFIKRIQAQPPSHPVNLTEMFSEFAYNGIYKSTFGWKQGWSDNGRVFSALMTEFMDVLGTISIGDFVPWLSWVTRVNGFDKRVDAVFKRLDGFLEEVIEEHLKGDNDCDLSDENGESFVDILIHYLKENTNCGDTISAVLEWIMVELLRHPKVMERLMTQVRQTIKHNIITDDDLREMHYLKAVIKESLRFHPPKPLLVPRVAREDVKVKGYKVKAGTIVMTNVWAIGMDPTCWVEPEKFEPERFLGSKIDFRGLDFELIPFGAGRRGCPGITFSMAAVELVVANIIDKFDWELARGEDMDTRERFGGTVRRAKPLLAVATQVITK